MTTPSTPADTTPAASVPASSAVPPVPALPSWPWRRAALILAGPGRRHRGRDRAHGLFFVSALAVLAVGIIKLWREHL